MINFIKHTRTHLFNKLLLGHFDDVQVSSVAVPVEGEVVSGQLLQDEQQQLIVVLLVGQVTGKCLCIHTHRTLAQKASGSE